MLQSLYPLQINVKNNQIVTNGIQIHIFNTQYRIRGLDALSSSVNSLKKKKKAWENGQQVILVVQLEPNYKNSSRDNSLVVSGSLHHVNLK